MEAWKKEGIPRPATAIRALITEDIVVWSPRTKRRMRMCFGSEHAWTRNTNVGESEGEGDKKDAGLVMMMMMIGNSEVVRT